MVHLVLCTVNQEVIGMDTILVIQMGIEFVYQDGVAPTAISVSICSIAYIEKFLMLRGTICHLANKSKFLSCHGLLSI